MTCLLDIATKNSSSVEILFYSSYNSKVPFVLLFLSIKSLLLSLTIKLSQQVPFQFNLKSVSSYCGGGRGQSTIKQSSLVCVLTSAAKYFQAVHHLRTIFLAPYKQHITSFWPLVRASSTRLPFTEKRGFCFQQEPKRNF